MTALSNQYCLPDGITPEIFLRDYWQKKPLIIRNGFLKLLVNLSLTISSN